MKEHHHSIDQDPEADPRNPGHFKVGTLSYTKAGLITVFLYLLWGDFCFTLMETVVPSILPLKLNAIGAPNWLLGLIVTTVPNLMSMVFHPFVSVRSDRLRCKWGRRIPFLAGATPFLVLFLILLGYSGHISQWLQGAGLGGQGANTHLLLILISLFMIGFTFFNIFIGSIYYYLFNDVVPHAFLSRFMALFRVVGGGAGVIYNWFILKHALTYMHLIFLGAGLLYLVAFSIMCWKVKEGEYPPPEPYTGDGAGFKAALRTYFTECFTHRFYWFLFLANSCWAMTWVSGSYSLLVATKIIGIDLSLIGKVSGVCGIIGMIAVYPAGMLADRFHPLRVQLVATAAFASLGLPGIPFIFLRHHLSLETATWIWMGLQAIGLPIGVLFGASELPTLMRLLPKEQYGQFCSANALIRSIALILGGVACGAYLDFVKRFSPVQDECYRFVCIWNFTFQSGSALFLYLLYREWKRLGGLQAYVPPSPEEPDGNPAPLEGSLVS